MVAAASRTTPYAPMTWPGRALPRPGALAAGDGGVKRPPGGWSPRGAWLQGAPAAMRRWWWMHSAHDAWRCGACRQTAGRACELRDTGTRAHTYAHVRAHTRTHINHGSGNILHVAWLLCCPAAAHLPSRRKLHPYDKRMRQACAPPKSLTLHTPLPTPLYTHKRNAPKHMPRPL